MTCIVAIKNNNKVYLAGDAAATSGHTKVVRKDPKVFKNGRFLLGFCGSFRFGQLMRFTFKPPRKPAEMDDLEFICTRFIPRMQECISEHGYSLSEESDSSLVVGFNGELYVIESDCQVELIDSPFVAIGSGRELAIGALETMYLLQAAKHMHVREVLTTALSVASIHNNTVSPPYTILGE